MSEPKLVNPGDPVFPKEVHNLLVAANATNITLSGMADTKASILMGASFVVFSMSISDIADGKASLPLLVLTMFSFVATIFGVLTVRPNKMAASKTPIPAEKITSCSSAAIPTPARSYIDEMIKVLSRGGDYRRLTADLSTMAMCCGTTSIAGSIGASPLPGRMVMTAGAVVYQLLSR